MKTLPSSRAFRALLGLATLAPFASFAAAPAAPSPSAVPAAPSTDEVITLSVFEVTTEKDIGYQSMATTSGTRTGELLRNLPSAISVINQELLEDTGITDVMQALTLYGVGVEQNGEPGIGLSGINGGGNSLQFRGIGSPWQGRDGFIWYGVSDSFNVETLEIARGAQGNVFGDSAAGGLPNIVSKRAKLRNFGNVNLRWDSEGGTRATIDYNRKLTERIAVRLNLLKGDSRDWRDTAYDKRQGAGLALQFDFSKNTRLSVCGEYNNVGRVDSQGMLTNNYDGGYVLGSGNISSTAIPAGTGILQNAGVAQYWLYVGGQRYNMTSFSGGTFRRSTVAATDQYAVSETVNPRHKQWNGPSNRFDHDATSLTLNLDHRFTPTTIVQAAYNLTLSDRFDHRSTVDGIRRDVNPSLRTSTNALVANPNFDQLYVDHRWIQTQYYNRTAAYRLTGVQDLDLGFTQQRIIVGGSLRDDRFHLVNRIEMLTPAVIAALGYTGTAAQQPSHFVRHRYYLRDGNDGALRHVDNPDYEFPETTGSQKTRAWFYSGTALVVGKYWKDRITTVAGLRRDNYEFRTVRAVGDPITGLGALEKGGAGEDRWREGLGVFGTSYNYGVVFSPQKQWRAFYNFAENFQQQGGGSYFNGESRLPRVGDGFDYGASVYLWKDLLTATVTRFQNKANNQGITALNGPTIDEVNALLGTTYTTGATGDTQARKATGTEVELVANLRPWTVRFAYSMRKNVNTDFAPRLVAVLEAMRAKTTDSSLYALTQQRYDALVVENPSARASWNYSVRYNFTKGPLKGARVGSNGSYRQGRWVFPAGRPMLYFKSYIPIGVFAAYEYKLTKSYRTDLQLNVDNILDHQTRLGGGYTGYSYLAPRKFTLSSTVRF